MPAATRHDQQGPPQAKYGLPGISYPTPNIGDYIITEDVPIRDFRAVAYGTPHPKEATFELAWQGPVLGDDKTNNIRRIYARTRAAQDAYNGSITYSGDDDDYPIFTRTYLQKRVGYAPAADFSPLTSIIGLRLTSGGTGYGPAAGGAVQVRWKLVPTRPATS